MRKTMRRLLCTALAMSMVIGGAACKKPATQQEQPSDATGTPEVTQEAKITTIGICQYADHTALNESREGFLKGLEEAGLVEGTDFVVEYQNAGLDDAKCDTIAKDFAAKGVDLVCGIGTNAAKACATALEGKNIPLVYAAVTDPEGAGLAKENITGTSDELRIDAQLKMIRELQPQATMVDILYSANEQNAAYAVNEYSLLGMEHGFMVRAIAVNSQDEVQSALENLIFTGGECITNVSDNGITMALPSILEVTNRYGIPVYGCDKAQVEQGCVAAAAIDYYELGRETGAMAAKIVKGEESISAVRPKTIYKYNLYINTDAISKTRATATDKIIKNAIDVSAQQ